MNDISKTQLVQKAVVGAHSVVSACLSLGKFPHVIVVRNLETGEAYRLTVEVGDVPAGRTPDYMFRGAVNRHTGELVDDNVVHHVNVLGGSASELIDALKEMMEDAAQPETSEDCEKENDIYTIAEVLRKENELLTTRLNRIREAVCD